MAEHLIFFKIICDHMFMPAGVVIYSVINMVLSIIPQVIIMGRVQLSDGSGGGG